MKIYGSFTSPFVRHCRIALAQIQSQHDLPCEFIETDQTASALLSPTQKVPYLIDGDLKLSDSSSILKYLREMSGATFLADIRDYELFCMVNTVLDASVTVFFMERFDGLKAANSKCLTRHNNRINSALKEMNSLNLPTVNSDESLTDGQLRLACYLDWALFRDRITLDGLDNLKQFLHNVRQIPVFSATAPQISS